MTTHCPECGRKLKYKHDGIFTWRYCPAVKSCGWDVFKAAAGSDAIGAKP